MALQKADGQTSKVDMQRQRMGNGTVGNDHMVPSGINSQAINNVVAMFDPRISYHGSWNVSEAGTLDYLSQLATSNTAGSYLSINFSGTNIALLGHVQSDGGRANITIDGQTVLGAVNTECIVSPGNGQYPALDATSTVIQAGGTPGVTADFASSGTIRIDGEEITYTSVDTGNDKFLGCTRGANGTVATQHAAGVPLTQLSSQVEFYAVYPEKRITLWNKNNLTPGDHTLTLTVDSTKDPSSSDHKVRLTGIVIGSLLGASSINTNIRTITISDFTDVHGRVGPFSLTTDIGDEQFLTPMGCAPVSGCNLAYPMWDTSGNLYVVTDAASTSVVVVLNALYLGPSI